MDTRTSFTSILPTALVACCAWWSLQSTALGDDFDLFQQGVETKITELPSVSGLTPTPRSELDVSDQQPTNILATQEAAASDDAASDEPLAFATFGADRSDESFLSTASARQMESVASKGLALSQTKGGNRITLSRLSTLIS